MFCFSPGEGRGGPDSRKTAAGKSKTFCGVWGGVAVVGNTGGSAWPPRQAGNAICNFVQRFVAINCCPTTCTTRPMRHHPTFAQCAPDRKTRKPQYLFFVSPFSRCFFCFFFFWSDTCFFASAFVGGTEFIAFNFFAISLRVWGFFGIARHRVFK